MNRHGRMRLAAWLLCLVAVAVAAMAGGCIQSSSRAYHFQADPNGTLKADAVVTGTDSQVGSITLKDGTGFDLEVTGLNTQDKVAALSAQQNMLALQLLSALLQKYLPLLDALAAQNPELVSATTPAIAKPVTAKRAHRATKTPTTQPASKP